MIQVLQAPYTYYPNALRYANVDIKCLLNNPFFSDFLRNQLKNGINLGFVAFFYQLYHE